MGYDFRQLEDAMERAGQGALFRDEAIIEVNVNVFPGERALLITLAGDTDAVDDAIAATLRTFPEDTYGTRVEEDTVVAGRRYVTMWRATQP